MKKLFFVFLFYFNFVYANTTNFSYLETFRKKVAEYYFRFLDNATKFLYDENADNYEYIKKHNQLKLYLENRFDENGNLKPSISLRANIKLPKINKNLYLTIDKQGDLTPQSEYDTKLYETNQKSRIGLTYYFLKEKNSNIYAKLGGKIKLTRSTLYLKAGADRTNYFEGIKTFVYLHEYFYFNTQTLNTETGINFTKRLDSMYVLNQFNNIVLDKDSNLYITNTFLIDQYLSKKEKFSYWTTLYTDFDNNSFRTQKISFNIKYHLFLKKWIYMDLIPSVIKYVNYEKKVEKYFYINFGFLFGAK